MDVLWLCSHGQSGLGRARYGVLSVADLISASTNSAAAPLERPRSILQSGLSIHDCQENNYLSVGKCRYLKSLSNYITLAGAAEARHAGWWAEAGGGLWVLGFIKVFAVRWNILLLRRDEKQGLWSGFLNVFCWCKIKSTKSAGVEMKYAACGVHLKALSLCQSCEHWLVGAPSFDLSEYSFVVASIHCWGLVKVLQPCIAAWASDGLLTCWDTCYVLVWVQIDRAVQSKVHGNIQDLFESKVAMKKKDFKSI